MTLAPSIQPSEQTAELRLRIVRLLVNCAEWTVCRQCSQVLHRLFDRKGRPVLYEVDATVHECPGRRVD